MDALHQYHTRHVDHYIDMLDLRISQLCSNHNETSSYMHFIISNFIELIETEAK